MVWGLSNCLKAVKYMISKGGDFQLAWIGTRNLKKICTGPACFQCWIRWSSSRSGRHATQHKVKKSQKNFEVNILCSFYNKEISKTICNNSSFIRIYCHVSLHKFLPLENYYFSIKNVRIQIALFIYKIFTTLQCKHNKIFKFILQIHAKWGLPPLVIWESYLLQPLVPNTK